MIIKDYDIWYTYSQYFLNEEIDLEKMAKTLVKLEIADLVVSSSDIAYWIFDEELCVENVGVKYPKSNFMTFSKPPNMNQLQAEFYEQAYKFEFHQRNLFTEMLNVKNRYIRAFLGKIYLKNEDMVVALYPQVKIYENGVVLLSLRKFCGNDDIPVGDFINNYVNLFTERFQELWMSSGIVLARELSVLSYEKLSNKEKKRAYNAIKEGICELTQVVEDEEQGFSFKLCNVPARGTLNLGLVTDTIFEAIEYSANVKIEQPLRVERFYELGTYWRGMPFIYLLDYENQPHSTNDLLDEHYYMFSQILNRVSKISQCNIDNLKEDNDYRSFDDYKLFINEAVVLWAIAGQSLVSNIKYVDANRGHLIYDKQVQSEMLLYVYALYHKLFIKSYKENYTTEQVIQYQMKINEMYRDFKYEASHYGEINNLLNALSKFGVDDLKESIDNNLKLKKELDTLISNKNNTIFSRVLSILFGILGASSISTNVVLPIWEMMDVKILNSAEGQKIESYLFTVIFLIVIIFIGRKVFLTKR
ncbi:hypothetical protein CN448_19020 [Bacillus cereus]|nr:hypothetical protein CN448_19020 [Bacillus cereus]